MNAIMHNLNIFNQTYRHCSLFFNYFWHFYFNWQ